MRRLTVAVVAFALIGSLARASERRAPVVPLTEDQHRAAAQFAEISLLAVDQDGVPTFVSGRLGRLEPGTREVAARRFVEGLHPFLKATGREELAHVRTESDELGQVHVRFQQFFRGLPVVGAELVVHADALSGEVHALNGKFVPDLELPRRATVGAEEALVNAVEETGIPHATVLTEPELVYVVADSGKTHLAWSFYVAWNDGQGELVDRVFADALGGGLVARHGMVHRAMNRKIYNGNHTDPDYPTLPGTLMFSEGATSSSDAAAWACYTNFGYTYNYYKARFNRDSFDNAGAALIGTVHVGTDWVNAYWNGTQMVFGDGDGSTASYLSGALDVVAHELTHAVTDRTADLTYSNESGALNEAMSDIFAAGTEVYRDGSVNGDTWKVGEDIWTPATAGDALRYMNNPTADGQSYDYYPERYTGTQDYGGVHLNSGIGNLAFYLVVAGGTHPRGKTSVAVPAIGMTKAEQVFYRALTVYMTSSTNFEGARNATAQAAQDLYTQSEIDAVHACWSAVGVPGGPVSVTTLANGQTISNLSGATGSFAYYKIAVPAGQSTLTIATSGGTGDADLYVKRGALPTTTTYDYRPYLSGNNETVTVSNPASGDWYIGLRAYSSYSGVSLQASFVGSTPTPTLALAISPTSLSVVQGTSGSTTATTTVGGGFSATVTLSASGLPGGASASFSPSSISAPGGGSSTLTVNAGTAAAGTYAVTVTASGGGLTASATLNLTVTASGGGVVVLTNGQTVSNLSAATGSWLFYKISVPSGQSQLEIKSSGGTGDADLYVKLGASPTTTTYDYRPYLSGNNETVTVSNPTAGDWYIGLRAYSSFSGVSLVATYTGGSGGGGSMSESENNGSRTSADVIPSSGTVVTGTIGTSTDSDYFRVTLPGYGTVTVDVTVPSTKDYDVKLYNSSGTLLASSTKNTGVAEHLTWTNSSASSVYVYIRVYGYNGAYSTTLPYQLVATW